VVLPGVLTVLPLFYPFIEARFTKDKQAHHLLQRPRDVPTRTALGAMALSFYVVLLLSGGNDVIADKFRISLNATTWAGRIGLLLVPPIAYWLTYRACLGLQQHDREVLAHGVETGIIKRLPDGRFIEVHQPLATPDEHGHTELEYAGWVVPKKMNRLGALVPTVKGFFFPIEEPAPPAPSEAPVSPAPRREEIGTGQR
jgi:ubiquinol-cytochrome c reductase cytochrome b subunit